MGARWGPDTAPLRSSSYPDTHNKWRELDPEKIHCHEQLTKKEVRDGDKSGGWVARKKNFIRSWSELTHTMTRDFVSVV